jgi:polyhydroxyalkanoate synthesis repressor PhaR
MEDEQARYQIVRYPNRRLYDKHLAHYMTLADVREKVIEGHQVCVIDKNSLADITPYTLLQVLAEDLKDDGGPLNAAALLQLIRGEAVQIPHARIAPGAQQNPRTCGSNREQGAHFRLVMRPASVSSRNGCDILI